MQMMVMKSFTEVTCYQCGCLFALESQFNKYRINDKKSWYCPNGHSQSYVGETEAEKLKKELAQEISRRASAEAREHAATRKLKRVSNGVCSECNRSFVNLQRHMKTKHLCKKP